MAIDSKLFLEEMRGPVAAKHSKDHRRSGSRSAPVELTEEAAAEPFDGSGKNSQG